MVRCKTELDNPTMKALARYHTSKDKIIKRRKNLMRFLGLIFILIGAVGAYDFIKDYSGTESILSAILSISIYFLMGAVLFITAARGIEYRLYHELKKYFEKTNIKCFEYIITENGIRLVVNGNASRFDWEKIDYLEFDDKYYYFGSEGKYNIISRESVSEKNKDEFESLMKNGKNSRK